jgi:hypothetical protein
MILVPKGQMQEFENTGELEDSKRRKRIHFFGADIAVSAFQGNYPYDPNNRKYK